MPSPTRWSSSTTDRATRRARLPSWPAPPCCAPPVAAARGGRSRKRSCDCLPPDVWLFADADLADTAALLGPVVDAVRDGRADVAIAGFPKLAGGGFGIVKRFAARAIRIVCGFHAREPLSGQRALTAAALATVRPLAPGFGLEVGMTIDAVRARLRVVEIPIEGLSHRPTGEGCAGSPTAPARASTSSWPSPGAPSRGHDDARGLDAREALMLRCRDRAGGGDRVVRLGAGACDARMARVSPGGASVAQGEPSGPRDPRHARLGRGGRGGGDRARGRAPGRCRRPPELPGGRTHRVRRSCSSPA